MIKMTISILNKNLMIQIDRNRTKDNFYKIKITNNYP